jgi:hypothetical protein
MLLLKILLYLFNWLEKNHICLKSKKSKSDDEVNILAHEKTLINNKFAIEKNKFRLVKENRELI